MLVASIMCVGERPEDYTTQICLLMSSLVPCGSSSTSTVFLLVLLLISSGLIPGISIMSIWNFKLCNFHFWEAASSSGICAIKARMKRFESTMGISHGDTGCGGSNMSNVVNHSPPLKVKMKLSNPPQASMDTQKAL